MTYLLAALCASVTVLILTAVVAYRERAKPRYKRNQGEKR